jgi:hypothetical protein
MSSAPRNSESPEPEPSPAGTGTTVATPEGDNEFAPDQPLEPVDTGHQQPPAIDTNNL